MESIVKISLCVAPILLVLCLAGFGDLLRALLDWNRPRDAASDIFESAFFGILFVTAGVLIANFFVSLGNNPGPYVAGIGLALVAAFRWRSVYFWNQLLLLAIATNLISYLVGPVHLSYDAGLYHISTMNWVANQPVPLGLGNLEGRLGFDSAWLLFESAFRFERYLGWSHLAVAEIAIRALVAAWIANGLLIELGKGWQTKAMVYFAAILALPVFILRFQYTTTDTSANLLAFCAWIAFCRLMLLDEAERRTTGDWDLVLLLVLVALAVTIKPTMLPVILLPAVLLVLSRQKMYPLIIARGRAYALVALYFALWLGRNFMLTGCLIYPVDVTCTTVPWGVGAAQAKFEAAVITGWARHPGPEALTYAELLNTAWIPAWFARQKSTWGGMAAAGFVVFMSFFLIACFVARFFVARRDRSRDHGDARQLVCASFVCAAVGLILWFLKMPDPRFSWVFFAILGATLVFQGFRMCDYAPPKIGLIPVTAKKRIIWSAVFAVVTTLATALHCDLVPLTAPIPASRIVTVSGGTQIYMPLSGEQCWELFPCTPWGFRDKSIGTWNGRYFFRSKSDY